MRIVPALAVSLWLGAMAFFAFVVAPAAFATLEREAAGRLVSAIFPRYYAVGVILGSLGLAACVGRVARGGWHTGDVVAVALIGLMVALTVYAWAVVLPAAHAAGEAVRRANPGQASPEAARFARLHRLSGVLNGVVMLAGAAVLAEEVLRRP